VPSLCMFLKRIYKVTSLVVRCDSYSCAFRMDIRSFFKPKNKEIHSESKEDKGNQKNIEDDKADVPTKVGDKIKRKLEGDCEDEPEKDIVASKYASKKQKTSRFEVLELLNIQEAPQLEASQFETHFDSIADGLLNNCILYINQIPHRLAEIEFYYYGHHHLDPFAHRDALQKTRGNWYFHKTNNRYREGTFKGIDITFGDDSSYGGILVRTIEMAQPNHPRTIVCGPSLTVDRILELTKQKSITDFVKSYGIEAVPKPGDDVQERALYLAFDDSLKHREIVKSPRVGLSLRKYATDMEKYFGKHYRYLTLPSKITKGKNLMTVGLYQRGKTRADISHMIGSSLKAVGKYIEMFEVGKTKSWKDYVGIELSGADEVCMLLGACASANDAGPSTSNSNTNSIATTTTSATSEEEENDDANEEI
jgi:hypothetical protein